MRFGYLAAAGLALLVAGAWSPAAPAQGPTAAPPRAEAARASTEQSMDRILAISYQQAAGYVAAQHLGYFAQEGLEVTLETATHAPTHNQGMADGRWDLTLSSADTMIARNTRDGTDYVLFMNGERGLDVVLVAAPSIASVADLRGQRLAGDPGDSNFDLHRRKILRDYGLREDDYEVEIIGSTPARWEALRAGRIVAAMLTPPQSTEAVSLGYHILAAAADHVPEYPVLSGWTRRAWAEAHRDQLVRFIRAYARATDWLLDPANREQALDLIAAAQRRSRDDAADKLGQLMPHAAIDPSGLARVAALRAELGLYDPPYDPIERFYDASYWVAATGLPAPAPAGLPTIPAGPGQ